MIELELTDNIKAWLDTAPEERNPEAGAELLLRITRNRILYTNIMRSPQRHADVIEYRLRKLLEQRLQAKTHEEVKQMLGEVADIAKHRGLEKAESRQRKSEYQRGKRADHNELPEEIQALYVENADVLRRMRDAHTKLRLITPETSTCPDNDRYPIAKYLIELDKKYRANWEQYDHYKKKRKK